jgi:glycosyltransferase involved in cell wall biosynthesis
MFVSHFPKLDKDKPMLLFVGNFYWLQNVEAAQYLIQEVFPSIQKQIPSAHLVIAGQNSSSKVNVPSNSNISIIDLKPDDEQKVKDLYHSATLFIAPIFGPGGTRLKILASMASGLPVISTQTGVEGLGVMDEQHVLIAKSAKEFVDKTVSILKNEKLYKEIQENSYTLVKKQYSWEAIAHKLENVYKGIMKHQS